MTDIASLEADTFRAWIGDPFTVALEPNPVTLTLVEVDAHRTQTAGPARQPFTLVLRGPAQPRLPQAIYALSHPVLGDTALLVVPEGPGADGAPTYAITFA